MLLGAVEWLMVKMSHERAFSSTPNRPVITSLLQLINLMS